MDESGFDATIGGLNTVLNLRQMSQNVTSSNIANADTPGYKAKKIEFEGALRDALGASEHLKPQASNPRHIAHSAELPVYPEIYEDPNDIESLDGNTVDRNAEMVKLAENQLLYDAAVELLKKKMGMLKYAISEGGGSH